MKPRITFIQRGGARQTVAAEENWSVMQIALEHKIPGIEGACGGSMACATCHVYVHADWAARVTAQDNEPCEEEADILDTAFDVRPSSRLGCQIKVTRDLDGLVVGLPGAEGF